jgi:hypothetical protein
MSQMLPRSARPRRSAALLLFAAIALVYLANGRSLGAGDTLPARYLPWSLLREANVDLDEFPFLYGPQALETYPLLDGVPYFLRYRGGHYLSAYSPGPALLALPVYAAPVLLGADPQSEWAPRLEKLSAAIIAALSAALLFGALGMLVARRWALVIAGLYAFGTSTWSVSSQALWQHGPSQLCIALVLYCLARGLSDQRFLAYAGLPMAAAVVMRPTDLLIVAPPALWIAYAHRHLAARLVLWGLPPALCLLAYNLAAFGSPAGGDGQTTTPTWALFAQVPLREGLPGLLLSPSRGLFIYSPIFLFSVLGFAAVWRRGPRLFRPLPIGVALVVLAVSKWFFWWGGYTWGPRLLSDTAPVFCFFLYPLAAQLDHRRSLKALFVALAAWSVAAHGLGAFLYDGRWDMQVRSSAGGAGLWSWRDGPLVFYGREAIAFLRPASAQLEGARPDSVGSPGLLAASYETEPIRSVLDAGESLDVAIRATNTGRAVWRAVGPGDRGTVRVGWRWSRAGATLSEGRTSLISDVVPGDTIHAVSRITAPSAPGQYALTIDLVSEYLTWFADLGHPAVRAMITVLPRDPARFLAEPAMADRSLSVAISTDRATYRREDSLRLTVELANPRRRGSFDAYLVLQGPDGAMRFFDGRRWAPSGSWAPWVRELPLPARATGRFAIPLSTLADGAYQWHVVLTETGAYRPLIKSVTKFTVGASGAARDRLPTAQIAADGST